MPIHIDFLGLLRSVFENANILMTTIFLLLDPLAKIFNEYVSYYLDSNITRLIFVNVAGLVFTD